MRPAIPDPQARERFDRTIIQGALDGRHLPPPAPRGGTGSDEAAADVLPVLLEALQEAHGVERWDAEAFERVLLAEALRAWHGDLEVERRGDTLVTRTRTCPVLAENARDARVCQMCRAFQAMAAQEAFGWRLHGVTFPRLATRGDGTCEMHLATAPPPREAQAQG